jgi:hypothetical protein
VTLLPGAIADKDQQAPRRLFKGLVLLFRPAGRCFRSEGPRDAGAAVAEPEVSVAHGIHPLRRSSE